MSKHREKRNETILNKLRVINIRLEKLEGETVEFNSSEFEQNKIELKTKWDYNIRKKEKDILILTANFNTYFVPEILFKLELEYSISYKLKGDVSLEEIKSEIEEILRPCGELNTMIVAQLTDKMAGSPLIVPPIIRIKDEED
ncbi:hypothetical protein H0A61_01107 [Koleobacter methoxysyntrophicus]|uniref:Uncharacterized protein n=1 Tax=Koleobacter methoxysyntrophicus TaxID=2751313 RepID=A0A8A0RLI9_9FIRM|nr:hypothetical protein [Koleobacter methoxysyntrophicus]QSQ08762.1 hypothetical protein H0A61_01107 [Koleobacter methoxysyntrophicus]